MLTKHQTIELAGSIPAEAVAAARWLYAMRDVLLCAAAPDAAARQLRLRGVEAARIPVLVPHVVRLAALGDVDVLSFGAARRAL